MRALHLQCAAQRLFQRVERVQRKSFQHARVKFRLPEKRSACRERAADDVKDRGSETLHRGADNGAHALGMISRGISVTRLLLIDRFVGTGEH